MLKDAEARERGSAPLLGVRGISKSFGGVQALQDVSFDVKAHSIHGLIGANGAGKSTLVKILAGVEHADSGRIEVDGHRVTINSSLDAQKLRFAFIHQEMSLIPQWNVLRNLALGSRLPTRAGLLDWRPVRARATQVAELLGMHFSLRTPIEALSAADQWLVLIGRALMNDARLIAMDEPTASLSVGEVDRLHSVMRDLVANHGATLIFISHRLDEIADLCEDITVFKDGRVSKRFVQEKPGKAALVSAIVGRDLEIPDRGQAAPAVGAPVLEIRGLADRKRVRDVSLSVHAQEIVGLGGLVGAGRTELAKCVFGAGRRVAGEILIDGRPVTFTEPAQAVAAGVGFVPEERRGEALFLNKSIDFNINAASFASLRNRPLPLISLTRGRRRAQVAADRVTVKARDVDTVVGQLSGGNQQKAVIARWLMNEPRLLILDEPSRGVDVGARAEVHDVIRELAAAGTAVLVISSDNEELVALAHRVVVMQEGRVTGELRGPEITEQAILELSFGHDGKEPLP